MIINQRMFSNPYNTDKSRNAKNTSYLDFNCGGYALNTFSWYCPYPSKAYDPWVNHYSDFDYEKALNYSVENILKEFPDIRVINDIKELCKDEYAIAFRICKHDFHFLRRGKNGVWYEKRGSSGEILIVNKCNLFRPWGMYPYNSRIVFFAKKF